MKIGKMTNFPKKFIQLQFCIPFVCVHISVYCFFWMLTEFKCIEIELLLQIKKNDMQHKPEWINLLNTHWEKEWGSEKKTAKKNSTIFSFPNTFNKMRFEYVVWVLKMTTTTAQNSRHFSPTTMQKCSSSWKKNKNQISMQRKCMFMQHYVA